MLPVLTPHRVRRITNNWRNWEEFDNHEFVIALTDAASGLKAFVAVHNRNLGIAHGGTRFASYKSEKEAIKDALELSRAMTYKSALAGLPYGGGKAVIMATPGTDRDEILKAYALKIEALNGLFHTGTDVGLKDKDIALMAKHCRYMLGLHPGTDTKGISTGTAAAQGVYIGIKAALKHRFSDDNLRGRPIGIKGLGKLGGKLAELLSAEGAELVLADVDQKVAEKVSRRLAGSRVASPLEIHREQLDVYAPCALGHEFQEKSVGELNCAIIAGGANNQLSNAKVGDRIFQRSILYAPDYVINAGGLIFVSEELESDGFKLSRIERRINSIGTTLEDIFVASEKDQTPTHRVAAQLAEKRIFGGTQ